MSRLAALLLLTAAFAPAAVIGALPVVAPVVVVLLAVGLAVAAFDPALDPRPAEVAVSDQAAAAGSPR